LEKIPLHIDKQTWWSKKTSKCNKGLAISGVVTIVTTALLLYFFDKSIQASFTAILTPVVVIGTPVYLLYMGTLNVILFALEFADYRFNKKYINFRTMDIGFNLFFWISMAIPIAYPIYFLIMFCFY
jgi:hypothetical protein